jgi:non-ribosomal peptide synthetase component F
LLARGIVKDQPIAVCLERSLDLAAAFLGVLKAGAGYLPLDSDDPAPALAFVLRDSGAPLVITESRWRSRLPGGARSRSMTPR